MIFVLVNKKGHSSKKGRKESHDKKGKLIGLIESNFISIIKVESKN